MTRFEHKGHITPADKARSDYLYVPFDLAQPARRIDFSYRYSNPMHHGEQSGGNVIDIGLFDPRGHAFPGASGFRGWSGSDRSDLWVGVDDAAPAYLAGPLPAGRYHVILGLYRIADSGCDFTVTVKAELSDEPSNGALPSPPPPSERPPVMDGPSIWLRGDLQCHTVHSDGVDTVTEIAAKARRLGLDFLAITDHNSVGHHPELLALSNAELLLIAGQEVTTYYGHMNIWGSGRWCDFRCQEDADMRQVIDLAHRHAGICSINHPKQGGPAWRFGLDLPVDAIEVWQGPWPNRNSESVRLWDEQLRLGRKLPAVGGSDYHGEKPNNLLQLGQPTTWVHAAERSTAAILDALARGRATISAAPDAPFLTLAAQSAHGAATLGETLSVAAGDSLTVTATVERGDGLTLQLIDAGGVLATQPISGASAAVALSITADRYIRAELVGDMPRERLPAYAPAALDLHDWRWALTNPIYLASGR